MCTSPNQASTEAGAAVTPGPAVFNACDYLPSFKRPRRIVFVTEYPSTSTGKIRRVELRTQAAAIMQGTVL